MLMPVLWADKCDSTPTARALSTAGSNLNEENWEVSAAWPKWRDHAAQPAVSRAIVATSPLTASMLFCKAA
jgi:hypothetical protein